ncbi:MAG: serine hydrolase domain-containing protein [Myxococcota bacterium]
MNRTQAYVMTAALTVQCALGMGCLWSQERNGTQPHPPEPTATWTLSAETEVDDIIRDRMEQFQFPGLAVAVVAGGNIVWARGYGDAHLNPQRSVTPDTPFLTASVSKTIVAVAVMQQVEAGRIDLDADINGALPFAVRHPRSPQTPITPRMLMTHTSAIEDNWDIMEQVYVRGDSPQTLRSFLEAYLTPTGRYYHANNFGPHRPGTHHSYTNIGSALLGLLVETVTQTSFDRYCHDAIFAPLGMKHTAWMLRDLERDTIATPYTWTGVRYRSHDHYGVPDYPSGQLRSSVNDMGLFLSMIIREGRGPSVQILEPSSIKAMLTAQIPHIEASQALIWGIEQEDGLTLLGHEGAERGATTQMFFRREDGLGYVLLANGSDESNEDALNLQAETLTEIGTLLLEELQP